MPAVADLVSGLAPGLHVFALGALLAFVLRRFYDRVPAPALAVFAVVVVVLYGPALFAGRTLLAVDNLRGAAPFTGLEPADPPGNHLQGDQVLEIAPLAVEVRRAVGRGEWPLASDRLGAGAPLLANPLAQALQPLVIAAWPLPLDRAAGVTAALRVLVALLFGYLLLRRLLPAAAATPGATRWAAVAGALIYGLGGYLQLWLGWPRANAAAWLPALLYAVLLATDRGRRRDHGLLVATVLAVLLGGDHNAAVYALLAAGALALVRLRRVEPARRTAPALGLLAATAIAFGLAAPVMLQAVEWVPGTPSSAAVGGRGVEALHDDPLGLATLAGGGPDGGERRAAALGSAGERLVPALAANALGNSRYGSYRGPANSNEDAAVFAGSVALLLVLCGAARRWRARRSGASEAGAGIAHETFFFALAAVVLAIVSHPPVLAQLLEHLPYLEPSPVYHQRAGFLFVLAVAALACGELDRLARPGSAEGPLPLVASALGLGAAIALLYVVFAPPEGWLAPRPRLWLAIQLVALAAAATALFWAPRRWRGAIVALLIAGELVALHRPANPSLPRRLFYPQTAPIALVQRLAADDPGARMAAVGPVLPPAIPAVYGLADARSRGRVSTLLYSQLLAPLLPPGAGEPSQLAAVDHPLLDLLGVRWLLTEPKGAAPLPAAGFPRSLARPRILLDDPAARVWERPGAVPRLFLPAAAEVWGGGRDWPARVAALDDVRRLSLVASHPRGRDSWQAEGGPGRLPIFELAPTRVRAVAQAPEGERLLASSILQDGGWRLLADGRRVPTVFANGPFVGGWLPAGSRRIELLYRPARFVLGMILAALAFCALAGWLGRPRRPRLQTRTAAR